MGFLTKSQEERNLVTVKASLRSYFMMNYFVLLYYKKYITFNLSRQLFELSKNEFATDFFPSGDYNSLDRRILFCPGFCYC